MEQIRFERIGEEMFHQVLDNGLNVFVFSQAGISKEVRLLLPPITAGWTCASGWTGPGTTPPPEWPTTWSTKCSTPERATRSSS